MSFSFLHSMDSNVQLFTKALEGAGVAPQRHVVREDLLASVTARGQIDEALSGEITEAIRTTGEGVDQVLLTCSSLSPVADQMKAQGVPVERTDGLLALAVFADALSKGEGSKLVVLVAAATTVDPTRSLFERCRKEMAAESVSLEVILLPNVWDIFLSGDLDGYKVALGGAIDDFLASSPEITHVALGQASMGPALAAATHPRAPEVWTVSGATRAYLIASEKV